MFTSCCLSRRSAKSERFVPCLYVGMTGLTPEERFANHKAGTKAAAVVKRYGLRLLPELYGQAWHWQEHLV